MAFGGRDSSHYPFKLRMNDLEVEYVKEARDLGVYFQSNYSFSATLNNNLKKAMAIVHIVRTTIKVRTLAILKKIYDTYFLPIITYGSEIFCSEMTMVKTAMRKGFRAFWRLSGGKFPLPDSIVDPYQECVIKSLCYFKRIQAGKTCLEFKDYFKFNNNETTRSFDKNELEVDYAKKTMHFNFFGNMTSRWYNELNPDIRATAGYSAFKAEATRMVKNKFPTPPYDLRPRFVIWQTEQY